MHNNDFLQGEMLGDENGGTHRGCTTPGFAGLRGLPGTIESVVTSIMGRLRFQQTGVHPSRLWNRQT